MPKTIIINNIKIKEFAVNQENDGKINLAIVYALVDDKNQECLIKRADLKNVNLTNGQKQEFLKVISFIINAVKNIEQI